LCMYCLHQTITALHSAQHSLPNTET
jgi:hypothetical protein